MTSHSFTSLVIFWRQKPVCLHIGNELAHFQRSDAGIGPILKIPRSNWIFIVNTNQKHSVRYFLWVTTTSVYVEIQEKIIIWVLLLSRALSVVLGYLFTKHLVNALMFVHQSFWAGLGGSVGCISNWRPGGHGFDEVGNILSWRLFMKYFL